MHRILIPLLVAPLYLWPAPAAAQLDGTIPNGHVTTGTLSFDGHATVGDFTGTTSEVKGEMTGGAGLSEVRGWVEAPVKSLDTGNGKRDKDLNKSLESDKFPVIRFELSGVTPKEAGPERADVELTGKMIIHGVTRDVVLPAKVRRVENGLRLTSEFPLNLKDYQIGGLSKMLGVLKMGEDIEVHVDLAFAPQ